MAAIVYLDVDDEITSAVARLRLLKEDRIALVLPHGSRLATSRINFRLLAREAANRQKTLEIVTGDASARALAATAGLPTHLSVAAFEGGSAAGLGFGLRTPPDDGRGLRSLGVVPQPIDPDDSPTIELRTDEIIRRPRPGSPLPEIGKRPPSRTRGRRLAIALALVGVLLIGGLAGFQLLPSASIVLVPATDTVGPLTLSITAQPGITQPDPVGLLIPATYFTFDVKVANTFPATGVNVVETPATGMVTFTNYNTGSSKTIPAGSIVSTPDGVEFRTTTRVTIPPAQIDPIFQGSTGDARIEAVVPGLAGNVVAGTIKVVPANENPYLTRVTNAAPTTGGTHTESKKVAQADVDAALAALEGQLATTFQNGITAMVSLPPGTKLFPETRSRGASTPTVDPKTLVGLVQASFDLGLSVQGQVLGVDTVSVATLAEGRVRAAVHPGSSLDQGSIRTEIGTPIVAGTTITFAVTARATETRDTDAAALLKRIEGLGLPQARALLGEYGDVTISVWPDWVTTVPSNAARVSLTINRPAAGSPLPSSGSGSPLPSGSPASPAGAISPGPSGTAR